MKRLTITILFILAWLPAVSQPLIRHPRMLNDGRLAFLRQQQASNALRWVLTKQKADAGDMVSCALVYAVTKDTTYSAKAIASLMTQVATGSPSALFSFDSYYAYRNACPAAARTIDWCYDQLTAAQKASACKWLMDNTDACLNRPGGWGLLDWNNNYRWGFSTYVMAAIACADDDVRGPPYIAQWYNELTTKGYAEFAGFGKGGLTETDTNYDEYNIANIAQQVDAYQSATGLDITSNTPVGLFLSEAVQYTLQSASPDLAYKWPLGEQTRVSQPVLSDYDRQRVLAASSLIGGKAQSDCKFWLDHLDTGVGPGKPRWDWLYYLDLIYYPANVTATDYRLTQPTNYFAQGAGLFFNRSSWSDPTSTLFGVYCGPQTQSHAEYNSNGFSIYKGGWLTANALIWGRNGTERETIYCNNITVGGEGQWTNGAGQTISHEVGSDFFAWSGEAGNLYKVRTDTNGGFRVVASGARRKIVGISGSDIYVISDRVAKADVSKSTEFHLHSKSLPAINGSQYSWASGNYQIIGQSINGAVSSVPENLNAGTLSSYRTDVVVSGGLPVDRLLNVLQVIGVAGAGQPVTSIACTTHDVVQVGKWCIATGKSENIAGQVNFTHNGATEFVITDLLPNTLYNGTISSASGSLRFSMPSGTSTIALTPGSNLPPPPSPVLTSIAILPLTVNIQTGTTIQFAATGSYSDGASKDITGAVQWNGSVGGIISASGSFSAASAGQFSVTASLNGISSNSASVTVAAPVDWQTLYNQEKAAHLADNQANAQAIANLTANVAAITADRDAWLGKYNALVAAIKGVLGIP